MRWGRVGGALDHVSYHTAFGTTLHGLDAGRYRVEVRSVDSVGQRSTPVTSEFDVSGEPPRWQRGLGFAVDFSANPTPDARHWRLSELQRQVCLQRTEAPHATLLIRPICGNTELRPASQLALDEPDPQGIRGRAVVVTDAPLTEQTDLSIVASTSPVNSLTILDPVTVGGSLLQNENLAPNAVALRISASGPALEVGAAISPPPPDGVEYHAPTTGTASPGALHRWELIFKAGRIEVLRNGELTLAAPLTVPWRQAHLSITSGHPMMGGELSNETRARIAFVGFTGQSPDPRPVTVHDFSDRGTIVRTAGAVAARVVALGSARFPLPGPLLVDVHAPPGQPPVTVTLRPVDGGNSTMLTAELPARLLTGELELRLRAPHDDAPFRPQLMLELTHPEGTIDVKDLEVVTLPAAEPKPLLLVHSPETSSVLSNGERTKRAKHRVQLRVDGVSDTASVVPWIAIQVDLGNRRILTLPTAAAGPALATLYEFTLDLSGMPDGVHVLVARLVPDRPGIQPNVNELSLRLGR